MISIMKLHNEVDEMDYKEKPALCNVKLSQAQRVGKGWNGMKVSQTQLFITLPILFCSI